MRHASVFKWIAVLAVAAALPALAVAQQAPRRIGGHPNLNGIWQAMGSAHWNLESHAASQLKQFWRLGAIGAIPAGQSVVKEGKIPYRPDALAKRDANREGWPKTDPEAACYLPGIPRATYLPYPFQIVQGDDDILFVYSFANANRAVHLKDTRTIDEVPVDLWMGWSNGRWDGDTLVVETRGLNGKQWLDHGGLPASDKLTVIERFRRPTFGALEIDITINDPTYYTTPWTATPKLRLMPDTELFEFICNENEKSRQHMGPHIK
jgi:hypothetical protein